MEGLQGWMAEIERKQGRMTFFSAAGTLVAVVAAGAALYFAITTKSDSATKDDLDALKQELDGIKQQVSKSTQGQASVQNSIDSLNQQIDALTKQQAQNAADIASLKSRPAAGVGTVTPAPTTPITPTKP